MTLKPNLETKETLAVLSFFASVGFGIAGTVLPPAGIIDSSMLYLIAQFLLFGATMMGFGSTVKRVTDLVDSIKNHRSK